MNLKLIVAILISLNILYSNGQPSTAIISTTSITSPSKVTSSSDPNELNSNSLQSLSYNKTSEDIDVSNRNITKIESNTFEDYSDLKYLDLSNNQLESFNKLNGLSILIELDLSNNQLQNIESDAFENSKKLYTLILSNNKLKILNEIELFKGLEQLRFLNLNKNQFESFNLGVMKDLKKLKQLDLSNNSIGRVYKYFINQSIRIDLTKNPISKNEQLNKQLKEICINSCEIIIN